MDSAPQGEVPIPGQVIGGETVPAGGLEGGDWRTQLQPESRQRIVNKIMETLKRHLPFSGQEGLQELKKIAVRFEEKIYTAATSQSDYLRKISLKMLTMETKSQNPMANSLRSNAASNSKNPQDSDSSSQTGNASGGDWQEEIYQKIISMQEMYYPELNEMYQRMAAKLQQHGALPQQPKNEQVEKLRFLKVMLERLIMFLQTNKNEIQPQHKDKIVGVEKQIVNILNSNMPRKPVSSLQQGQLTQPHMHAMQQSQQQQPQISQMHMNEGQMNSQMQSVNVQGPTVTTQQNNLTNLQHNSLSSVSNASNSRQNMMDSLQPGSNINPGQDSSSQTGNASGGDWQEEIYQKIKSMHGIYYPELNEMYQQMAAKLQERDALPQQPKNEQVEKLRFLKVMSERLIMFLRTNKNEIQPQHKDKMVGVEKQIVTILNSNRPWMPVSSLQQGQVTQPHMHAMQQSQQQRPQISQMHANEGQMNSQIQSMNVQGPTSNALNQMQQVAMSSLQQNPVSGPQLTNLSSISSQNGLTTLQPNVNPLQQIKQEQQMFSAQQLKQQFHFQQWQLQQQYMHRLQLIQQQQQAAQQQSGQLPAQQMMQLNQMNDENDVKMRHQMAGKSGVLPQHNLSGQRPSYHRLANDLRIIIYHVLILCFILLGLIWLANRIM